jgi:hypothetical protein
VLSAVLLGGPESSSSATFGAQARAHASNPPPLLLLLLLQAIRDFKQRILKYNEVYEPIDDRRLHYIKLIDM